MNKCVVINLLIALSIGLGQAQPLFNTSPEHFTTDIQANIYTWTGSRLSKQTPAGEILRVFDKPVYGNIASVDANVIKTLVFYQESGKIVLLDNTLSPIGNELDLFEHDLTSVTLAALFGNNRIVLFDETNQDLYITDLNLNVVSKTHCTFPEEIAPFSLQSEPDHCIMLIDSMKGIFFFDRFGTFEQRLPITGILSAQLSGENIIYLKDNSIYFYNRKKLEQSQSYPSFISNSKELRLTGSWLFILDKDGILHTIQD